MSLAEQSASAQPGSSPELVIVFARSPRLGQVKSRLAATLGAPAALQAYRELLEHALAAAAPQARHVHHHVAQVVQVDIALQHRGLLGVGLKAVHLQVAPGELAVDGDDYAYLFRARRLAVGDAVQVFDGAFARSHASTSTATLSGGARPCAIVSTCESSTPRPNSTSSGARW